MTRIDHTRCKALREQLSRLRAVEAEWIDLAYPAGDPRAVMPDSEMPQIWIDRREARRVDVVRAAIELALAADDSDDDPDMSAFIDNPLSDLNPYNVDRAKYAEAIGVAFAGRYRP